KVSAVPLPPPVSLPPVQIVRNAIETIKHSERPLVIVGKGHDSTNTLNLTTASSATALPLPNIIEK
ncbi:hypothetical protein TELCIR_23675, partial [Teladorsagia circumcincta]